MPSQSVVVNTDGWKTMSLPDCIERVKVPSKIPRKQYLEEGTYPVISQEATQISGYWNNSEDVFSVDKPLVIFGDHTCNLKFVDFDFVVGADGVKVLKPKEFLDGKFFFYQLLSFNLQSTGYARHFRKLKEYVITIPSLEEQQRIVSILDEAFENISETVLQTKNSLFQNNELYEQMLNQIFENSNGEWVEKTLDNICTVKRGSSPRPIKSYFTEDPNGVSWIKIGDTKGVDKYITKTKQKITKEGAERSRLVNKGDLILSNSMSYGKPFIMGISGYIHDGWFVLYVNKEVDSEFLFYALSSRLVQSQFSNLAAGSVVKNISGDLVKKAVIPIPPLSEQKQIVEDIKSMTPSIKSLTSISNAKLKSLDELKRSILQEAFNGTLRIAEGLAGQS